MRLFYSLIRECAPGRKVLIELHRIFVYKYPGTSQWMYQMYKVYMPHKSSRTDGSDIADGPKYRAAQLGHPSFYNVHCTLVGHSARKNRKGNEGANRGRQCWPYGWDYGMGQEDPSWPPRRRTSPGGPAQHNLVTVCTTSNYTNGWTAEYNTENCKTIIEKKRKITVAYWHDGEFSAQRSWQSFNCQLTNNLTHSLKLTPSINRVYASV